ncbi:MAG: MFS transporter [Trichlorobacter sp.]|uniref:MFS transporter n=1 Tax=Trichlorobacter sp. TaxID=2911007 RepID=UPI002562BC40|nr:MFS transporter [Trichlorobacter sp.]MDK9717145.1 MFS transporter [Trichlorobacter sp.]
MSSSFSTLRWRLFFTLALMYILVYFYRVSLAVVSADVSRDLSLTPEQLGTLAGILFYVYAVAQIPLGPMIDRIGPRLVISGCGLLTTLGGLLFSQAGSLQAAMAGRVLIGIGTASVLMATFTIFSHWYTKQEFGKVSGLMVAAGNLGNLAGTAPLAFAVGFMGWRSSFLVIALLQGLVTILIFLKVQDRPTCPPVTEPSEQLERPGMLAAWKTIAQDRSFWLLAAVAFCWYGNYLAVQGLWGGPFLMQVIGLSREGAGEMLMWTSVGFIIGSMLTDRIARTLFHSYSRTLLAGQLCLAALMSGFLGWLALLPLWTLPLYFLGIGLTVSTGVMIYPIIRASVPVAMVGTGLTSLNFFVLMGAAVAQQGMGVIIARCGGYSTEGFRAAFSLPVAGLLLASLLFLFARNCPAGE